MTRTGDKGCMEHFGREPVAECPAESTRKIISALGAGTRSGGGISAAEPAGSATTRLDTLLISVIWPY